MDRRLLALALLCLSTATLAAHPARRRMPATYEAGHFFMHPVTRNGHALRLMVDTGGGGGSGLYLLNHDVIARSGLDTQACRLGKDMHTLVKAFAFISDKALPAVPGTPCGAVAIVLPEHHGFKRYDGMLGAGYLPQFTWTFDYPRHALWLESPDWKPAHGMRRVGLHFPHRRNGTKSSGFARVVVKIGGQPVSLLLDTGATAHPTPAGKQAGSTATVHGFGVTSYITTSVMDRWHRQHPHWRMVENGDDLIGSSRLIEVPRVNIAGWAIGPVWFTERRDANFQRLSRWMDASVVGALGGNVLGHFSITLDYPHEAAWLTCAKGCRSDAH